MAENVAQSVAEGMKDTLTCSICFELFKEPKTLSCLHSFCKDCISKHVRTKTEKEEEATCPVCAETVLTEKLVASIQTNFNYVGLIDALRGKKCSQCVEGADETDAVGLCKKCGYLCRHCTRGHKRSRAFSEHEIEYFDKKELVMSTTKKCPKHPKEDLSFFCVTDDQVICNACYMLEHKDCSVNYINEGTIINECQQLLKKTDSLKKIQEHLEQDKTMLEEEKQQLNSTYESLKEQIAARSKQQKDTIEEETTRLEQELGAWYTPAMKQCAMIYDDRKTLINDISDTIDKCNSLSNNNQPSVQTLIDKTQLTKKINQFEQNPPTPIIRANHSHVTFIERSPVGSLITSKITKIDLQPETPVPTQGEEIEVSIKTDINEVGVANLTATVNGQETPIVKKSNGSHGVSWVPRKYLPQQVEVNTMDGQVKASLSLSVKRCYDPLIPVPEGLSFSTSPLGVCLLPDNTLAVTSNARTIKLIDTKTFTEKEQVIDGRFVRPYFMATEGDSLWVTDREAHNIKRMSLIDYEVNLVYGNKGNSDCQLYHPRGIAVSPDHRVFVADMKNNRIVVLKINNDNTASQVTTIGANKLNQPAGVTFNRNGDLAVCDDRNCRVVLYSSNGRHLQDIGLGRSGQGLLCSPIGIAVDDHGRYIVAEFGSHCVTSISKEGDILSSTRTVGGVVKEFTYPRGVALDSNGSIYVADHGNKRVIRM